MENLKVNDKVLFYSGGYDRKSLDGRFTHVTKVTPTGRFRIDADNEMYLYHPETLRRIGHKRGGFGNITPYCRKLDENSKKAEEKAMRRLWITRLNSVDFESLSTEQLTNLIGALNVNGIK
ncbi:MAG: hypothetical protein HRU18_01285 [Pseudoalteromonas sp.]|uniref:hypothetical protein n=1 Tax=Pseudoalteromonas sp. TaxID=53249 RepID=UPI001D82D4DE|nr:hypothetical protein [Pseudoalteromonas sp.]NRA76813.1 hypothetical protein [Pseudoalteromonas sp.]